MSQRAITIFPLAARTSHVATTELNTQSATNVTFEINVTALTGTSVTYTVQGYDTLSSAWFDILAAAAITGAGRARLHVGPNMPTTANVSTTRVLPLRMRILPSGTVTSVTSSIQAFLQR